MTSADTKIPSSRMPESAVRLEDRVYSDLLTKIREGGLILGQKLPSETELASDYGVSRPVVRSALAMLRDEGLIVSRRGAGSFVSIGTPEEGAGFAPLDGIDDIASCYRFRLLLESEAAALAATRAKPADIAELEGYVARMESLAGTGTATIEPDLQFHAKIAELSDNRFIVEGVEMLRPHMLFIAKFVRSLGRTGYAVGKKRMNQEHHAIIGALRAGDPKAARAAMTAHIENSQQRVFKGER